MALRSDQGGRLILLGGEPFAEEIVMWWNFIGRSHEEIVGYRDGLGAPGRHASRRWSTATRR